MTKRILTFFALFFFLSSFNLVEIKGAEANNPEEEKELFVPPVIEEIRQSGKGSEEVVYNLDLFNGKSYTPGVFSPLKANTIYIIADINNVFSPEITMVYFWPVTGEYVADWFALDDFIGKTLEIVKDGKVISSLEKQKYTLLYLEESYFLLVDKEATDAYQEYKNVQEAISQYWEDYINYQQKLAEYERKKAEGEKNLKEPEPPEEPQRPAVEITEPLDAFIVNLKEGKYKIRVRDDEGQIIKGTEKDLVVFSGKVAVGYQIVRKNNWPARCDDPLETIYVAGKDIFYFTPVLEVGFDNSYYAKLLNPQIIGGVKGAWSWVYLWPVMDATLNFSKDNKILENEELLRYYIDLIPGYALGFNILKYDEENHPEGSPTQLMAYKVELKEKGGYGIELVDSKGEVILGSEREIKIVREENTGIIYIPALLSLPFGLVVFVMRRRKWSVPRK